VHLVAYLLDLAGDALMHVLSPLFYRDWGTASLGDVLQREMVLDSCWPESSPGVYKRGGLIAIEEQHIQLAVSIEIAEREGHRHQVLPWPVKDRTRIEDGFTCGSPWKLDHLQMAV